MIGTNTGISVRCVLVIQPKGVSENQLVAEDGPRGYWLEADNQNREYRPENRLYVNASCRRSARCLDVLSLLPFGIMRSYPGFCRSKQLEYNPGLTHRRRAGHPRANRRTSDRPSFCGVRPSCSRVIMSCHIFQSTHPLRGATASKAPDASTIEISIHAPLAGCDSKIAEIFPENLRKSYKISAKPNKERRCRVLGKGKAAAISGLARCEPPGENRNASGSHQIMSAPSGA